MTARGTRALWEEATSWYARMQEPRSEQEVAVFEAWLTRDPAHARAYAEMEAISGAAAAAIPITVPPIAPSRWLGWRPALATIALIATSVTAILLWQGTSEPAFARITNPGAAVRGVRLNDGTEVLLDSGSEVRVRVGGAHRELVVEVGRVRIGPAAGKPPLAISAKSVSIAGAATKLDVAIDGEAVTLGALDGAISISSTNGQRYSLAPGKALIVKPTGTTETQLDRSWPSARLRFTGERLDRIATIANRQSGPRIVFADTATARLTVTGVLDLRDTRRLARKLAASHDLRIRDEGPRLVLHR